MKWWPALLSPQRCGSPPFAGAAPQRRSRLFDALHVFVLASFAIAQPAYDRLGARAAFLIDCDVSLPAVYIVMALVSVVIPLALVAVEEGAALFGRRVREAVHVIAVFLLLVLLTLPVFGHLDLFFRPEIVIGLALLAAVAGTWSYFASSRVRSVVTLATPGIVLFPGMFLFGSSVTGMIANPPSLEVDRWRPVPVVMVVFDEFCGTSLTTVDRTIDARRFPNFARLAAESTWFRNATTVFEETLQAVPAILSGRFPDHAAWTPLPAERPQNLFSLLGSSGDYELAVFEPFTSLAGHRQRTADGRRPTLAQQVRLTLDALARVLIFHVVPSGFGEHLPRMPPLWFGVRSSTDVDRSARRGVFRYAWDDDRNQQWEHFLRTLEPKTDATLYFMHLVMPHISWCYLPSGARYTTDGDHIDLLNLHSDNELLVHWGQDELVVEQQHLRYLLQLQYVDRLIGQLVDRLRETKLYDRCLLIVTADHGVSFRSNEPRRHASSSNRADILSIPLFIKRPLQTTGTISDRCVESIDILPTIADLLGTRLREPIDGRSVFDNSVADRTERTFCELDEAHRTVKRVAVDANVVADSDLPQLTLRRFGDSHSADDMYRIGPIPELIGRQISELEQSTAEPVEIELLRSGEFYPDTRDGIVPCFHEGRFVLPTADDDPRVLAIAVNGTIRAVTRTYRINGLRNRWAALIPESSFHAGKNDVRYYAVAGAAPDWQLSLCKTRPDGR